jgi:hypothetical protein
MERQQTQLLLDRHGWPHRNRRQCGTDLVIRIVIAGGVGNLHADKRRQFHGGHRQNPFAHLDTIGFLTGVQQERLAERQ